MKRSEINTIMREADAFIQQQGFYLPPFAYWTPSDWATKGEEVREIVENALGWDITDFGKGNYAEFGLFLFTVRNGSPENLKTGKGKVYAEKLMVVREQQKTPMHFHWNKIEDIINRGGGRFLLQLYNSTPEGELADTDVVVSVDGVKQTVPAGGKITLLPGESITLPQYMYHTFWAEGGQVLVGEVSAVNDDHRDNRFHAPIGRFPDIEDDEEPLHLLVNDYAKYYRP